MKKIIESYIQNHKISLLCEIGSFRNLLEWAGHSFSVPMVFGCSFAMGFGYSRGKDLPLTPDMYMPFYMAVPFHPFPLLNACKMTNSWRKYGRTGDPDQGWESIREIINEGTPVMVKVETTSYFKGIKLPFFIKNSFPLGGHVVVVIGYDEDENTVVFMDTLLKNPVKLPIDVFKQIRSVTDCYVAPSNEWSAFYFSKNMPVKEQMIYEGIEHFINHMLHPFCFHSDLYFGLEGLTRFCRDLPLWAENMDMKQLDASMFLFFNFAEYMCPGGSFLRKVYSDFLKEAGETGYIAKNDTIKEVLKYYKELEKKWSTLTRLMSEKDPAGTYIFFHSDNRKKNKKLLDDLYHSEEQAVSALQTFWKKL